MFIHKPVFKTFKKVLNVFLVLFIKRKTIEVKKTKVLEEWFLFSLEFYKLFPWSFLVKRSSKYLLLYTLVALICQLAKLGVGSFKEEYVFKKFEVEKFEQFFMGKMSSSVRYPNQINNLRELMSYCYWIYLKLAVPMFNRTSKKESSELNQKPTANLSNSANSIKRIIGKYCMLNINDLVLLIDELADKIRDVHIPSIIFKVKTSIPNLEVSSILFEIQDFSNHPIFQIHFCAYLIEQERYLEAFSFIKELSLIKHDQINRFY